MSKDVAIIEALREGGPMQKMLGGVFEELGGINFMTDWAEENPTEFVKLLMSQFPAVQHSHAGGSSSTNLNLVIHPALQPGPLDVVSDQ